MKREAGANPARTRHRDSKVYDFLNEITEIRTGCGFREKVIQECIPIDQPGDLPVAVHGIPKPRGTGCTKKWFAVKRSKLVFCAFYIVWI